MTTDIAVQVQNLHKVFAIYDRPLDRLRQMLARGQRKYGREFVALADVTFSLPRGQVLGLVGRNGAGKSTLLQIICRTLTPSSGSLVVNGRIAALLELGAGFNPEFSGRENIFLNAAILGLKPHEIAERFDEIVEFSGIRDFIDQPVKTYSSGMYVRLAFSIATSVDPDILVVDEALSVGDGAFARKSFERIMALREKGATILFCSHSLYQIEAFCDQAIWLERGRIMAHGTPAEVVPHYQQFLDASCQFPSNAQTQTPDLHSGSARLLKVWVSRNSELPAKQLELTNGRDELRLRLHFKSDPGLPVPTAAVTFHLPDGRTVASGANWIRSTPLVRDAQGEGEVTVCFPAFPLLKGNYHVSAHLLCEHGIHLYDSANAICELTVQQDHLEQGLVSLPQTWSVSADTPPEHVGTDGHVAPVDTSERWTSRHATVDDEAALLDLFQRCFGHTMPPAQWRWKYAHQTSPGMLAERKGRIVAFYGGMARPIRYFGTPSQAVQIGDVMVAPEERSLMTRRGAFFQVASRFLEESIGFGKQYLLGFGFPAIRALRLAERQGLYAAVGEMAEWRWPASPGRRSILLRGRRLTRLETPREQASVNALWEQMANQLGDHIVGERDANWLKQRFLNHPNGQYEIWAVSRRFSGESLGIVVLRRHETEIELLDIVAPLEHFSPLISWVRRLAGRAGSTTVRFLGATSLGPTLASSHGDQHKPGLYIPSSIWAPGPAPEAIRDRWWLTAGDTDFR